jgi:hypothetical protein
VQRELGNRVDWWSGRLNLGSRGILGNIPAGTKVLKHKFGWQWKVISNQGSCLAALLDSQIAAVRLWICCFSVLKRGSWFSHEKALSSGNFPDGIH